VQLASARRQLLT
jgi:hypothetical protein